MPKLYFQSVCLFLNLPHVPFPFSRDAQFWSWHVTLLVTNRDLLTVLTSFTKSWEQKSKCSRLSKIATLAQFSVTRRQAPGLLFYNVTAEETVDPSGHGFSRERVTASSQSLSFSPKGIQDRNNMCKTPHAKPGKYQVLDQRS